MGQPQPVESDLDRLPDAAASESAAAADTAPPLPANWFETRLAMEELAEDGDHAGAVALGDHLLEQTTEEFGADSIRLAEAHLLLASMHRGNGNYLAAEEQILESITIYENETGAMSPALIEPYLELGDIYVEAGDHSSASSAYGEARVLGRRNFGLLNLDQLEIIDDLTDAAEELGELEEARALQLEALTLIERNYPEYSPEIIDAMYKYASWLREQSLYEEERRLYFQIQRIVNQHYNDDPLMNVRALRERAASYRKANNGVALGLSGLYAAVDLLAQMPEPSPRLLAEVLIEIGDWNVEFSRTGAIGDEYLRAWEALGRLDDGAALREQWFNELNVVEMSSLSMRGLTTDTDAPEGFVVVYFTVDVRGRARDIEVTESQPLGLKDAAVIRLIREARFRPRIVGGETVTARRAYRFGFHYQPTDDEDDDG